MQRHQHRQRLHHFDHFRGLAIVLIIIGHCFELQDHIGGLHAAMFNVVAGGTALFVFISGFFFDAVFARNFDYAAFMRKKALLPFLPYLVMTALYLPLHVALKGELPLQFHVSSLDALDWGISLIGNVAIGGHLFAYWYVPFAMLLFAISPLVLRLMRLTTARLVAVTVLLLLVAMVIHRPLMNLNPFHSLVYFLPFYLAGIVYSRHRQAIDGWLVGNIALLAGLTVGVLAVMGWVGQIGNLHKAGMLGWAGLDWMVPRSLLMIGLILALLLRLGDRRIRSLEFLAAGSFALFLLHPWVIDLLAYLHAVNALPPDLALGVRIVIVLGVSIATAVAIKAALPRASHYLIGY